MNSAILTFNPENEKKKIITFLKNTFVKQKIENAVIGLSGGIDSTVSFYLLKEVLAPEHIFVTHMHYFQPVFEDLKKVVETAKLPSENIHLIPIKAPVDALVEILHPSPLPLSPIRLGNIAARMRMIVLFDLAKKYNALVCGTENRSENLLGYFTRFGDQASDIEPIEHLYKTQVYQLAKYLGVPEKIIEQHPTAGLWQGQTDEGEFGFTYEEADKVLQMYFDDHKSIAEIEKLGLKSANSIIHWTKNNKFKHEVPYHL